MISYRRPWTAAATSVRYSASVFFFLTTNAFYQYITWLYKSKTRRYFACRRSIKNASVTNTCTPDRVSVRRPSSLGNATPIDYSDDGHVRRCVRRARFRRDRRTESPRLRSDPNRIYRPGSKEKGGGGTFVPEVLVQ